MANYSPSPDGERERVSGKPDGLPLGLDPVSPTRFGEIIDADRDTRHYDYGNRPQPNSPLVAKRDQLSRATWVMIVIAGVVLGVAMAMIMAG